MITQRAIKGDVNHSNVAYVVQAFGVVHFQQFHPFLTVLQLRNNIRSEISEIGTFVTAVKEGLLVDDWQTFRTATGGPIRYEMPKLLI
ncbi:MAG: hypothetical protein ABJL67_09095 [Sulfitobacter sp.]